MKANALIKSDKYMFAAIKSNTAEDKVTIKVAQAASGFSKFKSVMLPDNQIETHGFTVMDTTEN